MIRRFTIAAALAGLIGLGSGAVYAQSSERLQANVPFDFKVGQEVLPAGSYSVTYDATESNVLTIRSVDGRHSAVVLTEGVSIRTPNRKPTLVFDRGASGYTLARVFGPGENTGLEVIGTPAAD